MTACRPFRITRRPRTLRFESCLLPTLDAVIQYCESELGQDLVLFCDLSIGACRSHQAACELLAQLGAPRPFDENGTRKPRPFGKAPAFGETVGAWIDAEGSGDPSLRQALELAESVAARLQAAGPAAILVFRPRWGLPWEPENIHFLSFLRQGLAESSHRLILVETGPDSTDLPDGWEASGQKGARSAEASEHTVPALALVPGLIEPSVVSALSSLKPGTDVEVLVLEGGLRLVAPQVRRDPARTSRLAYDQLATAVKGIDWLQAHAQCHGNNMYVIPDLLCAEAEKRVQEGGIEIAFRLLRRATDACRSRKHGTVLSAVVQAHLQGYNLALQRFADAAAMPDPPPGLPPDLSTGLLLGKGWGLVLMGRASEAEPRLRAARVALERYAKSELERLYVLNISALNRLRLNDFAGAMELEKQIEAALESSGPCPDQHLLYINSVNQARLYRLAGDIESSRRYYKRAFDTTLGTWSDNDAVYQNSCWARLEAARGRPDLAFQAWMRASLHWAAHAFPEGVGWRVASALLGRPVTVRDTIGPEEISSRLTTTLAAAAESAGVRSAHQLRGDAAALEDVPFAHTSDLPQELLERCCEVALGAAGWSVILASPATVTVPWDGPAHRELRRLLTVLIRLASGDDHLTASRAVLVENERGLEMPVCDSEIESLSARTGIPLWRDGGKVPASPQEQRAVLLDGHVVRVSRAVREVVEDELGCVQVHFRRYRPSIRLLGEDAQLVGHARRVVTLRESGAGELAFPDAISRVRRLERQRVLEMEPLHSRTSD